MMGAMLRAVTTSLALLAMLAGGAACEGKQAGEVVRFAAQERPAAPEIKGELVGGGSYDLATKQGKVVVVNFWGSWCPPCRVEADDLETVHKALPDVEFLGINIRDDEDKALAFMRDNSSYPSIFDQGGRTALKFVQVPPNTIPATIILDAQGRVATVVRKAVHADELRGYVDEVLKESQK